MATAEPTGPNQPAHAPVWTHAAHWPQLVAGVAAAGLVAAFVVATPSPAHHHSAAGRGAVVAERALAGAAASPAAIERAGAAIALPVTSSAAGAPSSSPSAPAARVAAVSTLASDGIPATALAAYERAAKAVGAVCHLPWPLLAAIGRVESDHGRFAGAQLYADGTSSRKIIGIPLDGHGTALIRDTDGGRLDGDPVYDRAVGPMQFIPSTWANWGRDGNGDGVIDPFNIYDAALAAASYLCAAGGDLSTLRGQTRAVLAYNHSSAYLAAVLGLERTYATGIAGLVVPVGPPPTKPKLPTTIAPVDPGPPLAAQPAPVGAGAGIASEGTAGPSVGAGTIGAGTVGAAAPTRSSIAPAPTAGSGSSASTAPSIGGSSASGRSTGPSSGDPSGASSSGDPSSTSASPSAPSPSCSSSDSTPTDDQSEQPSTEAPTPLIAADDGLNVPADVPTDVPADISPDPSTDAPSSDTPSSGDPQSGVCPD